MAQKNLRIGLVGATGMVGSEFVKILDESKWKIEELRPFASENSLGKSIECVGKNWPIQVLKDGCFKGLDLVFFSSGDDISKEWAPKAAAEGAYAVDNSAAFRMSAEHALVVPEINADLIPKSKPVVIANPNCSTIQLVVALKPLRDQFGLEEVRVASYQAVSGAGQAAYDELLDQVHAHQQKRSLKVEVLPKQIAYNVIPQVGSFDQSGKADGFTSEEVKIMKETKKILALPELKVSAFTVRVPVLNAHSEVAWVTLKKDVNRAQFVEALKSEKGLVVLGEQEQYPLAHEVSGENPVYVGRIHQDLDNPRTWIMWIVADNIRKGAALNGLQIAQHIFDIH